MMQSIPFAFVLLACSLFKPVTAHAQLKGFGIGPYVETAWPNGDFRSRYRNGVGAGIGADLNLPARLGLTGSVGYIHFSGKTVETASGSAKNTAVNAVPIRGGIKYRFTGVYVKVEAGVAKLTNDEPAPVIIAPGVGIRLLGLDIQTKYEAWLKNDTWSFFGLKVGYQF